MNHTTNYQLSQWAKSDRLMMDDFNADNAKIDAALKANADTAAAASAAVALCGNCKIETSTYTGTGTYGSANPVTLTFPQKPALIFVLDDSGSFLTLTPRSRWTFAYMGNSGVAQTVTWSGNSVSWWSDGGNANNQFNASNNVYQVFTFLKTNAV